MGSERSSKTLKCIGFATQAMSDEIFIIYIKIVIVLRNSLLK